MLMDLAAMLSPQNRRLFKFKNLANPEQELLLESFRGTEGLSRAYQFDLLLVCQDSGVELKSMMGQHVVIEIELADGSPRYIAGYLTRFASGGSDGGMAKYTATLNPWFSMLKNRFDTRIFQGNTVEEVVTQVFAMCTAFSKHEFRLSKPLKRYTYITQYRESDFNFVQRLLEEEGMFYYFEHTAEGHTMIICDDSTTLVPLPEQPQIRFHSASVTETADSITDWNGDRRLQSGKMAVQTFDYRQPNNRLPVTMNSLNQQGDVENFEVYDFPGQYTHGTYDEGEALLRLRVEALELRGKSFRGASNCRAMKPGYTFELLQHYDHDQGSPEDRQFLLVLIDSEGHNNYLNGQQASYRNTFSCVRKKIVFRPQLTTNRSVISGPHTAIVVGPPGEEIFTDELGRVKIQFHWDRKGEHNDKSSCWVRVAQSGASGGFGSIQIPRVGDEVVVVFLDGNPDRPLVMGSLYNSQNTPPWSLPANKTQSGFLTRSAKGDGGTANFFRFEDKAGAEQVIMHAERNMDTEIELDEKHEVGNNRKVTVGGTNTEIIQKDTVTNVQQGSFTLKVDNQFIQVDAKQYILLKVGDSSISITPEGIQIKGKVINVLGESTFVKGDRVDINK
ncbi:MULTISPECIES: type VI secretion system Vgr family protein [Pseudomonas]|jgi:type VI secretion system secreted protein VgrG|uniref:Type VI secretion system tip protein VgrG n=3 Tax=Pseudomonas syringae TaxID=317 RepID=A0A3M2XI89_PSESY|nr:MULTISPECIES: type VI secretion system tip protein VgrG [Pseudomonas]AKF53801.1 Rhs element Vgr protein [Pseudomonas syringae pv. syringae HS191]AVX25581.1 type VI secretion system tip protein VgrG [Pseudomonas syringae pv. atrofaciens]ELS40603.1 Putative type VI secretion system effector, VgrG family [Pseudomonas syringae pv. syringae B64]KFF84275.1 type IV secretion protein Rhs [Pseudomonas syringae pv. syringae]KPW07408.1 putative type VI secretion system effector, VgrG family [Pseudomon